MIQIGFSKRSGNVLSWIIRQITNARFSHCWLLIDDPYFGIPIVLQASTEGFTTITYSDFQIKNQVVTLINPKVSLDSGLHTAWSWLGTSYDTFGLIGMSFVMLGRVLKRRWNNPLASSSGMFCSEAIIKLLQLPNVAYPNADMLNPIDTGPEDLYNFLNK